MFNMVSYILFLFVSFYITIEVGRRCYKSGKVYLEYLLNDKELCSTINRILLGCYYLLNLGYITMSLTSWEKVVNMEGLIRTVALGLGKIILILCVLHYANLLTLYALRKKITLK